MNQRLIARETVRDCLIINRTVRGSQNCSDFHDREESHIAAIWPTSDRENLGGYDGSITVRFIIRQSLRLFF